MNLAMRKNRFSTVTALSYNTSTGSNLLWESQTMTMILTITMTMTFKY
jgi:hypothetical protein